MSLAELRSDAHYLGPGRALARAVYYRANRLLTLRHYRVLRQDLTAPIAQVQLPGPDFRWIMADGKQAGAYAGDLAPELDETFLRKATAAGFRCLIILDGNRAASMGWYTEGVAPLRGSIEVCTPPAHAYMFRGYTPPAYRGKRLHRIGLCLAANWYARRSVRGIFTIAESINYPSLKNARTAGYKDCGAAYEVGFSNTTVIVRTRAARRTGFVIRRSD